MISVVLTHSFIYHTGVDETERCNDYRFGLLRFAKCSSYCFTFFFFLVFLSPKMCRVGSHPHSRPHPLLYRLDDRCVKSFSPTSPPNFLSNVIKTCTLYVCLDFLLIVFLYCFYLCLLIPIL